MKQKPQNITDFHPGDIITRIEPAKALPGRNEIRDRSYIGKPFKFLGIANGCIYIEKVSMSKEISAEEEELGGGGFFDFSEMLNLFTGEWKGPRSLPLDLWEDGWSLYIDPYTFINEKHFENELSGKSIKDLKKMLDEALDKEDYNLAKKIKEILDKK